MPCETGAVFAKRFLSSGVGILCGSNTHRPNAPRPPGEACANLAGYAPPHLVRPPSSASRWTRLSLPGTARSTDRPSRGRVSAAAAPSHRCHCGLTNLDAQDGAAQASDQQAPCVSPTKNPDGAPGAGPGCVTNWVTPCVSPTKDSDGAPGAGPGRVTNWVRAGADGAIKCPAARLDWPPFRRSSAIVIARERGCCPCCCCPCCPG